MNQSEALRWGGLFCVLSLFITVVALAIITVGIALGGLQPIGYYAYTPIWLRISLYPTTGLGLILFGVIWWWCGTILAFYKTFIDALEAQTAAKLDTELIKSDILSVLDDRLADIYHETTQTRRLVDRISREDAATEFDFPDELSND